MPQHHRRLLATLSSIPSSSSSSSSSSSGPPSSFAPPYAHTTSPPRSVGTSLRPPYAHSVPGDSAKPSAAKAGGPSRINAPYRFSIAQSSQNEVGGAASRAEEWVRWAREQVDGEGKRKRVEEVWERTLRGLEQAGNESSQVEIPDIPYAALSDHLSDPLTLASIRAIGSLIVRDVVPDKTALGWARDIHTAMEQRNGEPVYWHPALLAARSNLSLLNTTSTVLSALAGKAAGEETWILAEGVREGLGLGGGSEGMMMSGNIEDVWAVDTEVSPSTPLLAYLALTPSPSSSSSVPSEISNLPLSIHSATYTLLRPLFRPIRSRISYYSSPGYLEGRNWALLDSSEITVSSPSSSSSTSSIAGMGSSTTRDMPHLEYLSSRLLPSFRAEGTSREVKVDPGDIILRNKFLPSLPPFSGTGDEGGQVQGQGQAFLPVSPLAQTPANLRYLNEQRERYEQGLPPVLSGGGLGGARRDGAGAVWVEETNGAEGIQGRRGRMAMGY